MNAVEHNCSQCSSTVESTSPFCPNCGAAQVRFAASENSREMVAVMPASSVNQVAISGESSGSQRFAGDDSHATIRAALYAGVIGALLSSLPVGPNFILALPVAGFLSVMFYRRWTLGPELRPSAGFKLGSLAGLFGFLGFLICTAVATLAFHAESDLRQAMVDAVRLQQSRAADPQVRQMFDYFLTPQGMMLMMGVGFLTMGIAFVILSGVGAALGASLLRRKSPPDR